MSLTAILLQWIVGTLVVLTYQTCFCIGVLLLIMQPMFYYIQHKCYSPVLRTFGMSVVY